MQFSIMNLEKAVLRIFRNLRIASGGGLRHSMLVKEWAQMSLRRGDLDATVKRMAALCYLRPERTPEGEVVYLTSAGYEYAEHLFDQPMQNLLLQLSLKLGALMRQHTNTEKRPQARRRLADRVSPSLS